MERKKTIYQLDTPFSAVSWPTIEDAAVQETILELLCSLLEPIGRHRRRFIPPSRGKGAKKRRKNQERKGSKKLEEKPVVPPVPQIAKHVDIGLASISRGLQQLISGTEASSSRDAHGTLRQEGQPPQADRPVYSAIFVAKHGQPTTFHCHFPQMVHAASKNQCCEEPIRLVGLSGPCGDRLSAAVGISRVSAIALHAQAPEARALVDFVRNHVPPVSSTWSFSNGARSPQYLETNIKAIETIHKDQKHANTRGKS
ncbi:hypothetical protein jhhlp_000885 [Lomentospora prolificans]|uniref:Uncharacterized protein n=1 Tax=Lomentospora prolificans TaxID=41688 RepID=A0A2N3NJQ0_9PEZI|nr:hypothetical protein jhhlp_000885 [Lomentospora prolificans]